VAFSTMQNMQELAAITASFRETKHPCSSLSSAEHGDGDLIFE
jgi:hypothetical protein